MFEGTRVLTGKVRSMTSRDILSIIYWNTNALSFTYDARTGLSMHSFLSWQAKVKKKTLLKSIIQVLLENHERVH